ncbi:F1F0 ATP synthase subunit e, mitochondrial [Malassezia equina]|uniref:ATP synthase F(0) complex subunit e, mitochondrial n=1 Tax=Malassezia equina TaxID=1381935 RepID=A0AAF0ECY8_9BASI|nr:F1F0 ATP synthase subunit e, mitochondrial [Malassezia equina]
MSPSPVVNIVRYSALVGGIAYGVLHRRSLQAKYDEHIRSKAVKQQEDLIKKAKEEYAKLQAAKAPAPSANDAVVFNPEDPNFNLDKVIAYLEKL